MGGKAGFGAWRAWRRRTAVALGTAGMVVPLSVALGAAPAQAATSCTAGTGPYQKQVEKFLGRPVDGRQSAGRLQRDQRHSRPSTASARPSATRAPSPGA